MNTLFPTNSFDLPMSYTIASVIARDAAPAMTTPDTGITIIRLGGEQALSEAHTPRHAAPCGPAVTPARRALTPRKSHAATPQKPASLCAFTRG